MYSATQADLARLATLVNQTGGQTLNQILTAALADLDAQLRAAPADRIGQLQGRALAVHELLQLLQLAVKANDPNLSLARPVARSQYVA